MAFQWGKFKYLLLLAAVFLILLILMEDKHEELNDSNVTVENSYMKKLNRQRKSVGASPVQYVAVAELTVPLSFSQDYVKGFINQLAVPISLQNSTVITDLNITAVCQQSLTGVQCVCQNQYVWAHNNCLTYPACDFLYAGACGCISAKPTGQMCIPRSELPTFDFTIRIDVNADATLINLLKSYLQTPIYAPYPFSTIMEVSKVDLTTECHLNSGGYQCRCGDQYYWPCDTCFNYGYCDKIANATCGCINGFPKDGQFCQTMTGLTNATACDPGTSTPSPTTTVTSTPNTTTAGTSTPSPTTTVTSTPNTTTAGTSTPSPTTTVTSTPSITSAGTSTPSPTTTVTSTPNTTTAGTSTPSPTTTVTSTPSITSAGTSTPSPTTTVTSTPNTTTAGTSTPSPTTTVTSTPSITSAGTSTPSPTTTVTSTPSITSAGTSTPSPTTTVTSTPSTTTAEFRRNISMKISEIFDSALTVTTSAKYELYSRIIKNSVNSVYQNTLTSYKAGSATILQFRPGSVIADFQIVTTSKTLDFSKANLHLASNLTAQGISVSLNSFAETVEGDLHKVYLIYPGKNMTLTCNTPDPSITEIIWSINDQIIKNDAKYLIGSKTLTVTKTSVNDNGKYACTVTFNSIPYISFQKMSIQPAPELTTNTSVILNCDGLPINLVCCVQRSYTVQWSPDPASRQLVTDQQKSCNIFTQNVSLVDCSDSDKNLTFKCDAFDNTEDKVNSYDSKSFTITLSSKAKDFPCFSTQYGAGISDEKKAVACDENSVGTKTVQCTNREWKTLFDNCVLRVLQGLVDRAKNLQPEDVPSFIKEVLNATTTNSDKIVGSTANIVAVVSLLTSTANISQLFNVDESIMETFLKTVDVIGSKNAQNTWVQLNTGNTTQTDKQTSSLLLKSTEDMGKTLTNGNFSITTDTIQLNRSSTNVPFSGTVGKNATTQIAIPDLQTANTLITTIVFSTFGFVLPARNITNSGSQTIINADVVAVIVNNTINNISFTFDLQNTSSTLSNPQCVFWNFSLLDGIGGWDSTGCKVKTDVNNTDKVTCECSHTTSFSILMSPFVLDSIILDFITYIGVGISMICLILSLIIEGIIWKSMTRNDTSYMRHVSIVNIALSLLIADICFIIGAGIVKKGQVAPVGPCSTATFFMHFFYLSLFFWMLLSALLLLYRTVVVFAGMSRAKMMIIAFIVGYGAPLLIAVITVAATAGRQGYIVEMNACWLNWDKTKAFLAFVVPALTIVVINLVVLAVVLYKMLRRGVGATTQPDEKHTIVVIARCVAILTPLFGLTWGFGIGTMVSGALGIHIIFAILNSLQGFFILVFAILLDSKIREELAGKLRTRNFSSNRTRTTSAGPSSSSGAGFFERFRRRNIYHVADSSGVAADSSSNSYTFTNT